jgi:hypothetical protein
MSQHHLRISTYYEPTYEVHINTIKHKTAKKWKDNIALIYFIYKMSCEISGSNGGENEGDSFLGYSAV